MANYNSDYTGAQIDSAVSRANSTDVTAGTIAASKAVVVDSNKDITGFRHITATGTVTAANVSLTGNVDLGDASGDTVTITGSIDSNLIPATDDTYDIGSATYAWQDLYLEGDITFSDAGTLSTTAGDLTINAGSGEIQFGNENLTTTGTIDSGSQAVTGNVVASGTVSAEQLTSSDDLTVSGLATIGETLGVTGVATFTAQSVHNGGLSTGALVLNDGSITDTSGTIDFGDENLTTTGTLSAGVITGTGFTIGSAAIIESELETIDGVTAGTVAASKAVVVDSNKDIGTFRNLTIDGVFTDGNYTFDTSGNVSGLGTVGSGAITSSSTVQGTVITATTGFAPDAQDGAYLGTSSLQFSDLFLADGAVVAFGDDGDVTLTHVADTGLLLTDDSGVGTTQLQFGDSGTYIYQKADGHLGLVGDTEIDLSATTIDINGAVAFDGALTGITNITLSGTLSDGNYTFDTSGNVSGLGTIGSGAITATGTSSFATAVQTPLIEYTDGDDAITIADGGGITAAAGITSTAAANTFGASSFNDAAITNVSDIALDSISADTTDINIAVSDNSATALTIKQGSDAYLIVDTADSSESVSIGTGISGTAISIGHGTSETTVNDNLTVTGNLTVSGTTTQVDSSTLTIGDTLIKLGQAYTGSAYDQGIVFTRGDGASSNTQNVAFIWDESADTFAAIKAATEAGTTSGNVTITDYFPLRVGALTADDASTFTSTISTASGSTIGNLTLADGSITDSGGALDFGDENLSTSGTFSAGAGTLTSLTLTEGNITNAGDINADSLSVDDSAVGLNIDFGGATTLNKISLTDNLADALNITESSNSYVKFVTSDSSEKIVISKALDIDAVSDFGSNAMTNVNIDSGTINGITDLAVADGGTGASDSNAWLNSRITTNADGSLNYDATGATAVNHDSLTGFASNEHFTQANITATGALDSGSITSGFGNIDIGSSTFDTTGAVTMGSLTSTGIDDNATGTVLVLDANSRISLGNNDSSGGATNTIFGYLAGNAIASGGTYNCLIGNNSGNDITTGDFNIAIASYNALDKLATGSRNLAIGAGSLTTADGAESDNIAIGVDALGSLDNDSSTSNIAIGNYALDATADNAQTGTIAIGYDALTALTSGAKNIAIGYDALGDNIEGDNNISIGYESMNAMLGQTGEGNTGDDNIAIGTDAMGSVDAGEHNSAKSNANIAIGTNALLGGDFGEDDKDLVGNIAIGYQSLDATAANTQRGAIAIGHQALKSLTSGAANTAIGYQAMFGTTSGDSNVAIGYGACIDMGDTFGNNNVFIGKDAAGGTWTTEQSDNNVAIGFESMKGAMNNTTYNTCVGSKAGTAIRGDNNTCIGYSSGVTISTGTNNTCIGYSAGTAGTNLLNGDHNICIGAGSGTDAANAQYRYSIGGLDPDADNTIFIGNATNHIYAPFNSGDGSWTYTSDIRQKTEIKEDVLGLDFINDLKTVTYKHKSPSEFPKEWNGYNSEDKEPMGGDGLVHGMIAQDVKKALDKVGVNTFQGWGEGPDSRQRLSLGSFVLPLIKAVQELSQQVEDLKAKIN